MPSRRIILPLPGKWLKPNTTIGTMNGRMAKATATKKYREAACEAARNADPNFGPLKAATVQCFFYHKDGRSRDKDNLLASMKAAFDGLADAGWVTDDRDFTHLPVKDNKDKDRPRVEIVVTDAATAAVQREAAFDTAHTELDEQFGDAMRRLAEAGYPISSLRTAKVE
jgi:crossover junction endodeoxyribonuclease RusA